MEKDKALFIAYYFCSGYNQQTMWQEFDKIYEFAEQFVQTYSQDDTWEDRSFEEYMDDFIKTNILN
jgi:hypothetical protein